MKNILHSILFIIIFSLYITVVDANYYYNEYPILAEKCPVSNSYLSKNTDGVYEYTDLTDYQFQCTSGLHTSLIKKINNKLWNRLVAKEDAYSFNEYMKFDLPFSRFREKINELEVKNKKSPKILFILEYLRFRFDHYDAALINWYSREAKFLLKNWLQITREKEKWFDVNEENYFYWNAPDIYGREFPKRRVTMNTLTWSNERIEISSFKVDKEWWKNELRKHILNYADLYCHMPCPAKERDITNFTTDSWVAWVKFIRWHEWEEVAKYLFYVNGTVYELGSFSDISVIVKSKLSFTSVEYKNPVKVEWATVMLPYEIINTIHDREHTNYIESWMIDEKIPTVISWKRITYRVVKQDDDISLDDFTKIKEVSMWDVWKSEYAKLETFSHHESRELIYNKGWVQWFKLSNGDFIEYVFLHEDKFYIFLSQIDILDIIYNIEFTEESE